jgi:hypothetical protein
MNALKQQQFNNNNNSKKTISIVLTASIQTKLTKKSSAARKRCLMQVNYSVLFCTKQITHCQQVRLS